MAFPARIKTWVAGDTVSASDLNTEFNIAINALSDGTKDLNVAAATLSSLSVTNGATFNGAVACEAAFVANAAVTLGNAQADAITIVGNCTADRVNWMGTVQPGWTNNLGLTLASGLLSLKDASGVTLSNTNPGYVCMASTTAGQHVILKCNANVSVQDDSNATSHFTNFSAGITAAGHWANDAPWFIYAINRGNTNIDGTDGNSAIAITRNPCMTTTPSAANNIGSKSAVPVTNDQTSILLWGTYTVANYVSLPAQLIGVIRMQWSTTSDDWTVQTLGNADGIGQTQLSKAFATLWTFPTGQMGADTGTHLLPNGGTPPVFTTAVYHYMIDALGRVDLYANMTGDGGTDGATAVRVQIGTPYVATSVSNTVYGMGIGEAEGATLTATAVTAFIADGTSIVSLDTLAVAAINNSHFGNGNRSIAFSLRYKAF